ncbi:hypothetical protein [Microbacterium sp. KNMS]
MARIQILPLPPVKNGEYERTPFILILDKLDDPLPNAVEDHLRAATGADLVLASMGEMEASGQLELTEEQRDALLQHLTSAPERETRVHDMRYTDAHEHIQPGRPLDTA